MPVRKFRSVEEMGDNAWLDQDDPRLACVIRAVWDRSRRMSPVRLRPGVRKYRSIDAMNRADELWEAEGDTPVAPPE